MIRALISGELVVTPLERTSKNGRPFALARASVPQSEGERVFCSVIAFQDEAVARLLQLKAGAAVSLAGTLKVSTWQAKDGSTITGTQLAVAPSSSGNLPYQLVKANPAQGKGAMTGVSYIQRVATRGGVAPGLACTAANKGQREVVNYQADYLFWAAN